MPSFDRESLLQSREGHNWQGARGRRLVYAPPLPEIPIPPSETGLFYPLKMEGQRFTGFTLTQDPDGELAYMWYEQNGRIYRVDVRDRYNIVEVIKITNSTHSGRRHHGTHLYWFGGLLYVFYPGTRRGGLYRANVNTGAVERADLSRLGAGLGDSIAEQPDFLIFNHDTNEIYVDTINDGHSGAYRGHPESFEGWLRFGPLDVDSFSATGRGFGGAALAMGLTQGAVHRIGVIHNNIFRYINSSAQLQLVLWTYLIEDPAHSTGYIYQSDGAQRVRYFYNGGINSGDRWQPTSNLSFPIPATARVEDDTNTFWDISTPRGSGESSNWNVGQLSSNRGQGYSSDGFPHIYFFRYDGSDITRQTLESLASGTEDLTFQEEFVPGASAEETVTTEGVTVRWYIPQNLFLHVPAGLPSGDTFVTDGFAGSGAQIRVEVSTRERGRFLLAYPEGSRYAQRGPYSLSTGGRLATSTSLRVAPSSLAYMTTGVDVLRLGYQLPSGGISVVEVSVVVYERNSAEELLEALRRRDAQAAEAVLLTIAGVLLTTVTLVGGVVAAPAAIGAVGSGFSVGTLSVLTSATPGGAIVTLTNYGVSTSISIVGPAVAAGAVAGVAGGAATSAVATATGDVIDLSAPATATAGIYGIADIPVDLRGTDDISRRYIFFPQQISVTTYYDALIMHPTANSQEVLDLFRWELQPQGYRAMVFVGDMVTKEVGDSYFIYMQALVNLEDGGQEAVEFGYVVVEVRPEGWLPGDD